MKDDNGNEFQPLHPEFERHVNNIRNRRNRSKKIGIDLASTDVSVHKSTVVYFTRFIVLIDGVRRIKCHYCNVFVLMTEITKDHVIPISKGGKNLANNIVPSCRLCNIKKGNSDYSDFMLKINL